MDDHNSCEISDAAPSFPSFIALRARHSELLQREPESEEAKVECFKDVEQFIRQAQATGAILSDAEERESGQNIINYWVSTLYRQDQVARLVTLAEYKSKLTKIGDVSCPYPGVRAFTEQDSEFFFGRQRQIDYLVGRLKEDRLLVIVGASGSGKTSLVQAGLLPALKKEETNDVKHFFFLPIVPGSEPLKSLALMIQRAIDPSGDDPQWLQQQIEHFKRDKNHLLNLIEKTTDAPAVIFIDQGELLYERSVHVLLRPFENILDFDNSKETIEPFLDNIVGVVQSSGRNHIVIIARRAADFEPYTKRLPSRVREVFEPARVVLPALYASELRDAIEKPAELLGVKFDEMTPGPEKMVAGQEVKSSETTVQALVREISGEPVGLPLLQFALPRLWEQRDGNRIPNRAFRDMVSCRAELSATAEAFYNSLQFFEQLTCRRLLSQLVRIDRELKPHVYPLRRKALYRRREKHVRVDSLIERLTEKQLVRITKGEVPGDDCVELTHSSLLRNWPRMSSWVESKRWARRRSQAIKVIGIAAVIAIFILSGFFVLGWQQQRTRSRDLARLSNKQLANNRFDLAMLLGLAAYQTEINSATRSNLHNLLYKLQFSPQPRRFLRKENFRPVDLSLSTEHDRPPSRLAAINLDGKIVVWDLNWDKGQPTASELPLLQERVARWPLIFSPDGQTLVTASSDPNVELILWNLATGRRQDLSVNRTANAQGSEASIEGVFRTLGLVFNSNGQTLFSAGEDGNVIRWDLKGPEGVKATTIFKHTLPINSIDLNAKENLLAAGDNDGAVFLVDVSGKAVRSRVIAPGHATATVGDEAIYSVAFNSSGQWLAASRIDVATVWQAETGKLQREFCTGLSPTGLFVTFNDQDQLLGYNTDGNIFSWNVQRGVPLGSRLYKPANPSQSMSFSSNGKFLALPSDDGAIVWDIVNQRSLSGEVQINSIAFKPGGGRDNLLAVGEEDGIVLWEAKSTNEHKEVGRLLEESEVLSIDYSPDGSVLAAGLINATISLRDSLTLTETATLKRDQELQDGEEYAGVVKTVFDPRRDSRQIAGVVNLINLKTFQRFSEIILWDLASGNQIHKLPVKENSIVTDLAFRPDGELLVWTSRDSENRSTVAFWDSIKKELRNLERPDVKSLAFSPNGKMLAVGLDRGRLEIWDEAYERTASLEALPDEVVDLAFSPDGSILACATNPRSSLEADPRPGTIVLWDMKEDPPEQLGDSLKGHADAISNIAFSPDGRILASGSKDKSVLLWDVNVAEARKQLCEIIDCPGTFKQMAQRFDNERWSEWLYRKTIKEPSIDNETWFQWLHRKAMRKPSLRELHQ